MAGFLERHFTIVFIGICLLKLVLAYVIPVNSDEAYFWVWGQYVDVNYYDHPPMTGWIAYLSSFLGNHIFFYRLFPVLTGVLVAMGLYQTGIRLFRQQEIARLICLAFLVSPLHMLFVPLSTDTPLFLFVFLSGIFFYYAQQEDKVKWAALSGICLGLAFLSKYFSGLLIITYGLYVLIRRNKKTAKHVFLIYAAALPFVLANLYWNYQSCWTNILFNFFSRPKAGSFEIEGFLSFLGFQLYLVMPWMGYYLAKHFRRIQNRAKEDVNVFFLLFLLPISILGLASFLETGLHWYRSFYPFLYIWLGYLQRDSLLRIISITTVFSGVHILALAVLLALPVQTFQNHPFYRDIVMGLHGDEIHDQIQTYEEEYVLGAIGYPPASLMSYHTGKHFIVFREYTRFGRHDDKLTDYRELDGKNILIVSTRKVKGDEYGKFFKEDRVIQVKVRGAVFDVVLGKDFDFASYRDIYLKEILEDYYRIPDFLPVGDCFFYDKYFPELETK